MIRVTEVQSQVLSYQRLKQCYLMPTCLTLCKYKVRIKGKEGQFRKWSCAFSYSSVMSLLKRESSGHPRLMSPTLLFLSFFFFKLFFFSLMFLFYLFIYLFILLSMFFKIFKCYLRLTVIVIYQKKHETELLLN